MTTLPATCPALVLLLALGAPLGAQLAELGFETTRLNADDVATGGVALQANDLGQAVGNAFVPSFTYTQAGSWSFEGVTTVLPTLPDHEAGFALGITDDGVVLGETDDVVQQGQLTFFFPSAVVWLDGATPTAVEDLVTGGATNLELFDARRMDGLGRIYGQARDPVELALRPYRLDTDGTLVDLGSLDGPATGRAEVFDVARDGTLVGASRVDGGFDHAYVLQDGVATDLHDPSIIEGQNSHARAINAAGLIVGSADFSAGGIQFEQAAMWIDGVPVNLGTLGGEQGYARAINEHGTIVGTSSLPLAQGGGVHAFIVEDGVMTDLNDLIPPDSGWVLANAYDVTNDGAIVGDGFFDGGVHPYLAVPDCKGGFTVYGAGCDGSNGLDPRLRMQGCPTSDGTVTLTIVEGQPGAPGLLTLGTGTGIMDVKPGCPLQNLPLAGTPLPLGLDGVGRVSITTTLPGGLPPAVVNLQAILADGDAPGGLTVSNPIEMAIE